jgi:hypothetical protein
MAAAEAAAAAEATAERRRRGVPQLTLSAERIMQTAITSLLFDRPHEVR